MRIQYPIEKLENWQLAYIAGIIDGEGSLGLSRQTNREACKPLIRVVMTNKECIHFLHAATGIGNFNIDTPPEPRKTAYRWSIGDRLEIYVLLKTVCPYLIVKKKQADVMLEFVERRIQGSRGRDLDLWEEMHKLNK